MPRSLPERTVDAYLSIAVAARFPEAGIWDPTNTPGMWDATVMAAGKTLLFESKGNEEGSNDIVIDLQQLDDYLSSPVAALVFYLLADPCWSDARLPLTPGVPATTWDTFPDWAYVVPAAAMATATGLSQRSRVVRPSGGTFTVPATGDMVPAIRLRTFLDDLEECFWVTRRGDDDGPIVPGDPSPGCDDLPIGGAGDLPGHVANNRDRQRPKNRRLTAVAVHLPL